MGPKKDVKFGSHPIIIRNWGHLYFSTSSYQIWKGTPYYAHMKYNNKKDPADGLPDEDVTTIEEIPVYSINKPKPESQAVLSVAGRLIALSL